MLKIVQWAKHPTVVALALYGVGFLTIHSITVLSMLSMVVGGGFMMWSGTRNNQSQ